MPELLVELICEPLPRWAQNGEAPKELARRLYAGLKEKGLLSEDAPEPTVFATPLRLAFRIPGVAENAPERMEEKRGPREGSPDKAIMGFARSVGLIPMNAPERMEERRGPPEGASGKALADFLRSLGKDSIADLKLRESKDRKGKFWFADIKVASQPADALIPEIIIEAMRQLPWQKTMRWEANGFRWPRPLYRYLVLLGNKPLSLASVAASLPQKIEGGKAETLDTHGNPVPVSSPDDWQAQLETRGITLSFEERSKNIHAIHSKEPNPTLEMLGEIYNFSFQDVMDEFASMTEAPRTVRVSFGSGIADERISHLPVFHVASQVLQSELRSIFYPARDGQEVDLMFVAEAPPAGEGKGAQISLPANWVANLQGAVRRVANARLADIQFYWKRDEATGLDKLHESLKDMRYHLRLGSLYERSERLANLSRFVAQKTRSSAKELGIENGEDVEYYAEEAGRYAQADLASETIKAFPKHAGRVNSALYVCRKVPQSSLGVRVHMHIAMEAYRGKPARSNEPPHFMITHFLRVAEHTDALVGLWAAGERATGSGDPFAMRRHVLYLSFTLLHNLFEEFSLHDAIEESARLYRAYPYTEADFSSQNLEGLKQFIFERLRYAMLEVSSVPHDILQAAIYSTVRQKEGIMSRMWQSAFALHELLVEEDGKNLQAAWVRASGLAKGFASDKKFVIAPDSTDEEVNLCNALEQVERSIQTESSVKKQIRLLAQLRKPIDNFLDHVRVLEGTQAEQENRLALLRQFMNTVRLVADLDYLEGGERAAYPPRAALPPLDSETSAPTDAAPSAPGV